MADFHFTRKAVEDLSQIWEYTMNTWSEEHADKYYNMLIAFCRHIATSPCFFHREYTEIESGLYGVKAGKHIIFYKITENKNIEVIRILHERMDLKTRIKKKN